MHQAREQIEHRVAEPSAELARALAELRELAAHQESVREQERSRIARDIHDELGSLLVALKLDLGWLDKRIDGREPLQLKCQAMGRTIDTAVANLGRIVTELRPSILDHQGLWAALEWQAQEFIDTNDVQPDMRFHVAAGVPPLTGEASERWSIAVYRIFQGLLDNVACHARASTVSIRLYVDEPPAPVLHLELRDDGVGATPAALAHPRGHGIRGMRERAGFFGGTLSVDSVPGAGTVVRLTMPLPGAAR
jgi:signal transduction histidine kinase